MSPEEVLKQYEERINLHRFDELLPLIAKDAVFWFNDGSFTGIEQIRAAFERTWSALADDTYWLDELSWVAVGKDIAGCLYNFHWRSVIDDKPVSGGGRGTSLLRVTNGQWQIVHEHLSSFPPALG